MLRTSLLLLGCLLTTGGLLAQDSVHYLHCGTVIDGTGTTPRREQTLVVREGKIERLLDGYATPPAGATATDLKQHTVLPGLIDLHVHVESQSSPTHYLERFTMDPADVALRATSYARATVEAGFTTVRDLGGTGVNVSLRDAINRGYVVGPRIITAEKAIATTGGHADPSNGRSSALAFDAGPDAGVINSADEAYKAVRTRYKNGADCIKITATGGVLSVAKDGSGPQFTEAEVAAIVAAAKDYGMHTAAHAHGVEGMQRAIRAGITTIEHGSLMDDETVELMKEYGTYYVPTLSAGKFVAEKAKTPGYYPTVIVPKAISIGNMLSGTFARAYRGGVTIAFGTDAGVGPHGTNAREFGYMVEAGMPEMEAILTATKTAAEVLDMAEEIGRLAPGFAADVIAVRGNPLEDITVLESVDFVMKAGELVKAP